MATYNGHRSWNAWNVSLWIGNDEGLYNLAMEKIRQNRTRDQAARAMTSLLQGETTPDGARYNYTCIREAIRDLA